MGKHGSYERVPRDLYPTPAWPVACLNQHVALKGLIVWEPAAGTGSMVRALRNRGAYVTASDIVKRRGVIASDFLGNDKPPRCNAIITNPPFGVGGRLALAFIERGLERLEEGAWLCLLLPCDFDSASTRAHVFGECRWFAAKIVLRKRIVWFQRHDGVKEAPKENSAWFIWKRVRVHRRGPPALFYAP